MNYEDRLKECGVTLLEELSRVKEKHLVQCNHCQHQWSSTPLSITQAFKKHGANGCPNCYILREQKRFSKGRKQNIKYIKDKGFEVLSEWDGRRVQDKHNTVLKIKVKNNKCNHVFESSVVNLLTRNVSCPVCAKEQRTETLNRSSKQRSEEYQKTANEWDRYRHNVYMATRKTYHKHKEIINPDNLPRNKAGVEGAYHLDHIVPVRYCFENNIPVELCAHPDNLQMLPWKKNIQHKHNLKTDVPTIFEGLSPE